MHRRVQRAVAIFEPPARGAVDGEEEGGVEGVGGGGQVGARDVAGAAMEDEARVGENGVGGGGHVLGKGRRGEGTGRGGRFLGEGGGVGGSWFPFWVRRWSALTR